MGLHLIVRVLLARLELARPSLFKSPTLCPLTLNPLCFTHSCELPPDGREGGGGNQQQRPHLSHNRKAVGDLGKLGELQKTLAQAQAQP